MTSLVLSTVMGLAFGAADDMVPLAVRDELQPAPFGAVRIEGFLGERISRNISGRLAHAPMEEMLAGFQRRPGRQEWVGEHIGKWLHAAVNAWQYSGDESLRKRADEAVVTLLSTQQPDGYLGTYLDKDRWTSWDVWVHKYNLIGLLTYYRATGDRPALEGARRIGDLLVATFAPDKRDIIASSTHVGMAATSVLEPMVELYRLTGEMRYLEFCTYLIESWDGPKGPRILSGLLDHGKVNQTANGKAYEMMSNLVGLCDLYRVTGDTRHLKVPRIAWDDIEANQLYITGGTSHGEHFQPDGRVPDRGPVAETCANVTWMQLCERLLALTGDPKYADPIEQLVYNHLFAAQAADGEDWCYFTVLVGKKLLHSSVNCCHSSGPRGISLIPSIFYGTSEKRLRINLYGESSFKGKVAGVGPVEVYQRTRFPADGRIEIEVRPEKAADFRMELRIPPWSPKFSLAVNGEALKVSTGPLAVIDRRWEPGDKITLELDVTPRWVPGTGDHESMWAARRGPVILCASDRWNPSFKGVWIAGMSEKEPFTSSDAAADVPDLEKGLLVSVRGQILSPEGLVSTSLTLGPFACVQKEPFMVWLPTAQQLAGKRVSLLFNGREAYTQPGDVTGFIADNDPLSYRVTFNKRAREVDYWEVTVENPVEINQVVFHHGRTAHNGGWFDTSGGKPEVLVRMEKDGEWKPVGRLESYAQTTADKPPAIDDGQAFALDIPVTAVYGVRVSGKPACGDAPKQAFTSCGELAAYRTK